MVVNINAIRQRRNEALKSMSVVLVRKLLLDDLEQLIYELERLQGGNGKSDPSGGEWQLETYTARRTLASGEAVEYEYQREWKYEDGKKVVRHLKNAGRKNGRKNGR